MAGKIQIKFGKAHSWSGDRTADVDYAILARRGRGEWQIVGAATAMKTATCNWPDDSDYRIGDFEAYLFENIDDEIKIEVGGYYHRRGGWQQHHTVAEAKRMIKAWCAGVLATAGDTWAVAPR